LLVRPVAALLAAGVLAACSSGDPAPTDTFEPIASPTATDTPTEDATPTETTVAVDQIPPADQIDEAYVQAVIDALDGQVAELARIAREDDEEITERVASQVTALYTGDAENTAYEVFGGDFPGRIAREPSAIETRIERVHEASPDCISFVAYRDLSPLGAVDVPTEIWGLELRPSERSSPLNPTAWKIAHEGYYAEDDPPPNRCEGSTG
jgi:hypothetical protein